MMETHLSRRCAGAGTRCRSMPGTVWTARPMGSCRPLRRPTTLVAAYPTGSAGGNMKERAVQILKQERGELRADQKEEAKQLSSLLIVVSSLPDDSFKDLDIDDKFPGPSVMAWAENKQQQSAGARAPAPLPPVVKPEGNLLRYLTGLTEEERVDVFSKLAAAGYAAPGREDKVDTLSNDMLEKLGIEPQALRSELLKAFALSGPSKAVVLVDEQGNEEDVEFKDKRAFELWAATNILKLSPKGGRKEYIKTWERLQDGGRYYTTRTLEKTVADLENYQKSQDKGLEDEVAEKALADMRQHHKEARRLFCGKGGVLHNKRLGVKRRIDEIILADNCYQVLEVKQVVDPEAAEQLGSGMEFIKQGIADGEADFSFARRSDNTLREMKGALGGLRMVSGDQHEQELKQHIAKGDWGLYLVSGGRMGHGSSCHEMPSPAQCEAHGSVASAAAPPPAQRA